MMSVGSEHSWGEVAQGSHTWNTDCGPNVLRSNQEALCWVKLVTMSESTSNCLHESICGQLGSLLCGYNTVYWSQSNIIHSTKCNYVQTCRCLIIMRGQSWLVENPIYLVYLIQQVSVYPVASYTLYSCTLLYTRVYSWQSRSLLTDNQGCIIIMFVVIRCHWYSLDLKFQNRRIMTAYGHSPILERMCS